MGRGRQEKRLPIDRQVPRRLDHQASYGCRGCPDGRDLLAVGRRRAYPRDAPKARKLLRRLGHQLASPALVTDRAYEGNETRQLALDLGFTPVVPPHRDIGAGL